MQQSSGTAPSPPHSSSGSSRSPLQGMPSPPNARPDTHPRAPTSTTATAALLLLTVLLSSTGMVAGFRSSSTAANGDGSRSSGGGTSSRGRTGAAGRGPVSQGWIRGRSFGVEMALAAGDILERHRRTFWDDLAPPFGVKGLTRRRRKRRRTDNGSARHLPQCGDDNSGSSGDISVGQTMGEDDGSSVGSEDAPPANSARDMETSTDLPPPATTMTHLCFLVHGHRGYSRDLGYLQAAIQGASVDRRRERSRALRCHFSKGSAQSSDTARSDDAEIQRLLSLGHDVIVYNAVCNEGRTKDGVRAGGERLVEEMLEVIRAEASRISLEGQLNTSGNEVDAVEFTLSIVGNSLGGIYTRYAIAQLFNMSCETDDGCIVLDQGRIRLHLNTFCTTATPHLGCSQHTWVSIPRPAELAVGHALGETGRDLFRMTDLLRSMSTDEFYLKPLSKFKKRVAYANGYHTDFPVPASTAAFLHENSTYPHHFWDEEVSSGDDELDKYIVAVLQTPSSVPLVFPEEEDDELKAMSQSLDALGWKKIIVDLRSEIPIGVSVPTVVRKSSLRKKFTLSSSPPIVASTHLGESKEYVSSLQDVDTDEEIENGAMADSTAFVETLKRRSVIESRDVKEAFSAPRDATIRWPVGHNMICAFSRGRVSSHMNRGGRSVMDRLARDLAEDMHGWEPPSDK